MKEIKKELISFIEKKVFPIYATFDKGHDLNHITAVIKRAINLYEFLNDDSIDINVLYASAALHDIGIAVERENHALHSKEFVLKCNELKNIFSQDEIDIIAQAVADHSTSKGIEPRSIYGKIVCDADEYTKKYFKDYTQQECLENVYKQLVFKFGEKGKVKFWINSPKQEEFKQKMYELAMDKNLYIKTITDIIERSNDTER